MAVSCSPKARFISGEIGAKSRPRLTDELRQRFPSRAIEIVVWRNSRHDGALRDAVGALITAAPDGRRPQ